MNEAVRTEAMRVARNIIKAELKRQGLKVSWIEASEITRAARHLIRAEPNIVRRARYKLRRKP